MSDRICTGSSAVSEICIGAWQQRAFRPAPEEDVPTPGRLISLRPASWLQWYALGGPACKRLAWCVEERHLAVAKFAQAQSSGMGRIHYEQGCDAKILSTLLNASVRNQVCHYLQLPCGPGYHMMTAASQVVTRTETLPAGWALRPH